MTDGELYARTRRVPAFAGLKDDELREILTGAHARTYDVDAGEIIVSESDCADRLVVLLRGNATVHMVGLSDDARHLVQRLRPGSIFGISLIGSELENFPAMVTAESSCEVMFLSLSAVRLWIRTAVHHRFLANLLRLAACDGFTAWRKLMLLSCYETADRILLLLRWREDDGNRAPMPFRAVELAETIGVNRTALYRALAKLKAERKIILTRSHIVLSHLRH